MDLQREDGWEEEDDAEEEDWPGSSDAGWIWPSASSVCVLQLLVHEVLRYQGLRPQATGILTLNY